MIVVKGMMSHGYNMVVMARQTQVSWKWHDVVMAITLLESWSMAQCQMVSLADMMTLCIYDAVANIRFFAWDSVCDGMALLSQ